MQVAKWGNSLAVRLIPTYCSTCVRAIPSINALFATDSACLVPPTGDERWRYFGEDFLLRRVIIGSAVVLE
jgi:antitoxin component of MazEF toxin-antitoxin module